MDDNENDGGDAGDNNYDDDDNGEYECDNVVGNNDINVDGDNKGVNRGHHGIENDSGNINLDDNIIKDNGAGNCISQPISVPVPMAIGDSGDANYICTPNILQGVTDQNDVYIPHNQECRDFGNNPCIPDPRLVESSTIPQSSVNELTEYNSNYCKYPHTP